MIPSLCEGLSAYKVELIDACVKTCWYVSLHQSDSYRNLLPEVAQMMRPRWEPREGVAMHQISLLQIKIRRSVLIWVYVVRVENLWDYLNKPSIDSIHGMILFAWCVQEVLGSWRAVWYGACHAGSQHIYLDKVANPLYNNNGGVRTVGVVVVSVVVFRRRFVNYLSPITVSYIM